MSEDDKAVVVLAQSHIDQLTVLLEQTMFPQDQLEPVYSKLMSITQSGDEALVVFDQSDIDQLLVLLEEAMFSKDQIEPVYSKLMSIDRPESDNYRIKTTSTYDDTDEQPRNRDLEPRDNCPTCGGAVDTISAEPLEEAGIEPECGYYRAVSGGDVIHEQC